MIIIQKSFYLREIFIRKIISLFTKNKKDMDQSNQVIQKSITKIVDIKNLKCNFLFDKKLDVN
jgi:hypothetical protein